eukprot:7129521-Pyramimonas_sp.AAC.1
MLKAKFLGWAAAEIAYRDGESDRPTRSHRQSTAAPELGLTQHSMVHMSRDGAKVLQRRLCMSVARAPASWRNCLTPR